MNILILSAGRRTKLVEYFVSEFTKVNGQVIATDCDRLAPALYIAHKYYITPKIFEKGYIDIILDICKNEKIDGILSLIDPELSLLAENEEIFSKLGVKIFISSYETTEKCFDKYSMFQFLKSNGFNCAMTYIDIKKFKADLENGNISFPVFVKPRYGSASIGISKVDDIRLLELLFEISRDLIIQEFLEGEEYGSDVYVDYISYEVVSLFVKKKLRMRAGETDKAVSYKNEDLFKIIIEFVNKLKCRGPIDIDIFNVKGSWYISEVNPRFGGGYPHAYVCDINIPNLILNNLMNSANTRQIGNYKENVYMIKHDSLMVI